MIQSLMFYLFAGVLVGSGAMVIAARGPVHAVLFLILAFFNAAGLMLLLGAEFLAFILVIVYVGAVAVLFLFVVMMLDVGDPGLRRERVWRVLPLGGAVGGLLLAELLLFVTLRGGLPAGAAGAAADVANTEALGAVLYTRYVYLFQAAGMVLLLAMVAAIALTLRRRPGVRRQSVPRQNRQTPGADVRLVKVRPGSGL